MQKQKIRDELIENQEESKQEICVRKQRQHERFMEERRQLKQYEQDLKETIAKEKAQETEFKRRASELEDFRRSREAELLLRKLEEE